MLKVCTFENFLELIGQKKIVCFGAGRYLAQLYNLYNCEKILDKIEYVMDNNSQKWDERIILNGEIYQICSVDVLNKIKKEEYIILITCLSELELLKQLEEDEQFCQFDVYCLRHLLELYRDYVAFQKRVPRNLRLSEEPLIPKKIHYCWFGGNPIPDQHKVWMESWRKFCPDYEIIEWNESNYDITKNAYMREAYENKKWAFVPDYARLDIIYHHGGIYLDTDVEIIQNIDDLLYQKGFAGYQSAGEVAFGLGFGGMKGLPIIKELRDLYDDLRFVREDGSLNMIASPAWQTKSLRKHGLYLNGECQLVGDLTIYPEKVLCGKSYVTMQLSPAPYTKMIHHFAASWVAKEDLIKIRNKSRIFEKLKEIDGQS